MTDSINNSAVAALAENAIKARFEDLDKETIETIKARIIDIIGCAIGGANAPGNRGLIDLVKGWGCKGEASILVHGGKLLVQDAAMINAVIVRSYDFEEQSPSAHQNATIIPVALALGEMLKRNGKDFLTALIVGTDVGHRINAGFDFDFYQGFDNIGSLHTFASAAIAGRLLGLTPSQLRNAFGIALHQTAGSIQSYWDCDTTFKLNNGFAARSGIFAAQLAKTGLVGTIDALQARFGYYNLYTHGCTHPERITQDLGKKYVVGRDMYKQFPCGRPNHVPIELAIALANEHDIKAADIAEVTLSMPHPRLTIYYAQPFNIRSYPVGDALFSYRYTMASGLLRRHMDLTDLSEEAIRDPAINNLISKINLKEIPGQGYSRAELKVKMKDGREFTKYTESPEHGLQGRDEIKAKFMTQVEFSKTVPVKNAEKIIKLLEKLEEVDNISQIIELTYAR